MIIDRTISHSPYRVTYSTVHYYSPRDYYSRVDRRYIYRSWLQEPVYYTYTSGYWMIDSYPYYVHQGYRYRYHPTELCRYQLVDGSGYSTVRDFGLRSCSVSYDTCARERDNLNYYESYNRYFCAEGVDSDFYSNENDYYGYGHNLDYHKQQAISNFLYGKSYRDLFEEARYYNVGNCSIQSASMYNSGSYIIRVGSQPYPMVDGSISSHPYSASRIGCNVGSEKENAGCILRAAIQEGYCI